MTPACPRAEQFVAAEGHRSNPAARHSCTVGSQCPSSARGQQRAFADIVDGDDAFLPTQAAQFRKGRLAGKADNGEIAGVHF